MHVSHNGKHLNLPPFGKCPMCHTATDPTGIHARSFERDLSGVRKQYLYVLAQCTSPLCHEIFLALYERQGAEYQLLDSMPKAPPPAPFPESIAKISPSFLTIYNQAIAAEIACLDQIYGMALRKAVEFLIKDYAKISNPEVDGSKIEGIYLGPCIEKYISSETIKECAKRMTWIGNDETHYIRLFDKPMIEEMKELIDATVYWIAYEEKTKHLLASVQKPAKPKADA